MLLLGHRGARSYSAENTLHSFVLALEHGCAGFEFDVRRTSCGALAILHDPKFKSFDIESTSLADLRTGGFQNPVLEDVMREFAHRAYLDIELKVPGCAPEVCELIAKYPPQRGYVVTSFLPEALNEIAAIDRLIPLGWLCDEARYLPHWRELPVSMFLPNHRLITESLVQEVHAAGKTMMTWTVNKRDDMLRLASWRLDGIISDDTRLLFETLGADAPALGGRARL